VGTVLLNTCQVIERPSKKDGFCFKLFHPLEQSIWAPRGPEKEAIGIYISIIMYITYTHTHTHTHTRARARAQFLCNNFIFLHYINK